MKTFKLDLPGDKWVITNDIELVCKEIREWAASLVRLKGNVELSIIEPDDSKIAADLIGAIILREKWQAGGG